MKFKSILAAGFAAAAILTGCVKENQGAGGLSGSETAKLSVSIELPTGTRANDQDANAAESAVNSIDVFVFNSGGTALATGGWTGATSTEFSATAPYKLVTDITAVVGVAKIYVALNLPKDIRAGFTTNGAGYATERALLSAFETVARMSDSSNANFNGFTMFSGGKSADLKASDDASLAATSGVNVVQLSVDRVVSKVAASYDPTKNYVSQWSGTNAPKLTYTVSQFNVYNEATDSYLVEQATTKSTLSTYADSKTKTNKTVVSGHPATAALRADMDGFYVGENASGEVGNTTHVMVATTVSVDKAAKWDATNGVVVYEDATAYGAGSTDVYVIKKDGVTYVTNADNINALALGLATNYYTYHKGYVHFRVWLNQNGKNDYSIGRNEFVHVMVDGIKALDGQFPGFPGDPTTPEKPIDPDKQPVDTNNPYPEDPTNPVDGEEAALNVEISINKWTYKANATVLE